MVNLPPITSVFLNVTNSCNLACRYCFVEQHPESITLQVAKDAADFLVKNSANINSNPCINFFGGEPLLMWDEIIIPITEYIRRTYGDSFDLAITSNCTLIDEAKLKFMKQNKIGLLFSIDGDQETQDWNRPLHNGGSSFEILQPKFKLLLEYFPELTFRSTITPKTASCVFHNAMFASTLGHTNYFCIPNILEPWTNKDFDVLSREIHKFAAYFINSFRQKRIPLSFSALESCFSKIGRVNSTTQNNLHRLDQGCTACGKCGLGANFAAGININGDMYSCQEFSGAHSVRDKFYIGSIYTGVSDELRRRIANEFDSAESCGDGCSTCILNDICDGGCAANNYFSTGDINKVPETWCRWERLLFNESVYIMQTLGNERNDSFKSWLLMRNHYGGR